MGRPEGILEDKTVAAAEAFGAVAFKFTSPGMRGVPDRIFAWPGAFIEFVEFKWDTDLSEAQKDVIAALRERGVRVRVIDSYAAAAQWLHERWEQLRLI